MCSLLRETVSLHLVEISYFIFGFRREGRSAASLDTRAHVLCHSTSSTATSASALVMKRWPLFSSLCFRLSLFPILSRCFVYDTSKPSNWISSWRERLPLGSTIPLRFALDSPFRLRLRSFGHSWCCSVECLGTSITPCQIGSMGLGRLTQIISKQVGSFLPRSLCLLRFPHPFDTIGRMCYGSLTRASMAKSR